MPSIKSVSDIKSSLLRPALTSHYMVEIALPSAGGTGDSAFRSYLQEDGVNYTTNNQDKLNLLCSGASLPGSSVMLFEVNNDRTGVTERHAHRKAFDDRIDLEFYVDAEEYMPIMFFESWIRFISGTGTTDQNNPNSKSYHYRMNYPDEYTADKGLKVIKFERDYGKKETKSSNWRSTGQILEYEFYRAFPFQIATMPVSYDTANLLKCTVSMNYIRYTVKRTNDPQSSNSAFSTISNQNLLTQQFFDQNGRFTLPSQNIA